jgi:hypothetical protein
MALVQANSLPSWNTADPGVVAQEHVAGFDARVGRAVAQRPVDGEVDGADEHRVVEPDLDLLAELVGDGEVEVVGVGDDRRAGHALERLAHLVGDRPQPVPDDLVGQRSRASIWSWVTLWTSKEDGSERWSAPRSTGRLENCSEPGMGMLMMHSRR